MAHDPDGKRHIFDQPRNVKRLLTGLYVACGLSVVAELFVQRHAESWWEGILGFYPVYGFVAIVILILAAKELRKLVRRAEDYYDD